MRSNSFAVLFVLFLLCLPLMAQSPGIPFDTFGQDQELIIVDQGQGAKITIKIYDAKGIPVDLPGGVSPGNLGVAWQWPTDKPHQLNIRQTVKVLFTNYVTKAGKPWTAFLPGVFGSVVVESDKPVYFEVQPVGLKFGQ